jgi:hypothetical protein
VKKMISVKDFVSNALLQIAEGISEANTRIFEAGIDMEIASDLASRPEGRGNVIRVDFDILLSASENHETDTNKELKIKGEGAFRLWVLQGDVEANASVSGELKKGRENISAHRIQFSVMVQIGAKQIRENLDQQEKYFDQNNPVVGRM